MLVQVHHVWMVRLCEIQILVLHSWDINVLVKIWVPVLKSEQTLTHLVLHFQWLVCI